jgi:FAD/FMN-containing dehydrogenase
MATINIAGLDILLEETPSGPVLSNKDQWLEPLAWVVNVILSWPHARGAIDALERGGGLIVQGLFVTRPEPDDPYVEEAKANWREWTGRDAGEDIYVVGTTFIKHEVVIPRPALVELLNRLYEQRRPAPPLPPAPWLFRVNPISRDPCEGEEEIMRGLERRAAELDASAKEAAESESVDLAATVSARRRFLLLDLNAAGLFHEALERSKRVWLDEWGLHTLLGYFEAALKLVAYFSSADRRLYLPGAGPEPVLGARVSVDWYRLDGAPPRGFRPEQWLGYCESILIDAKSTGGGGGDIFVHHGELRYRLHWRKDDGVTPALVSAAPL